MHYADNNHNGASPSGLAGFNLAMSLVAKAQCSVCSMMNFDLQASLSMTKLS